MEGVFVSQTESYRVRQRQTESDIVRLNLTALKLVLFPSGRLSQIESNRMSHSVRLDLACVP
jgi:hypothetical protein